VLVRIAGVLDRAQVQAVGRLIQILDRKVSVAGNADHGGMVDFRRQRVVLVVGLESIS
jgi:hypothetical protein